MAVEDYSWIDRTVHRIAFGTATVQALLCDMEAKQYGKRISRQAMGQPIFITSLPRAGTTLLLQVLTGHPDIVSHTHRDMPFVLSPIVWQRLSRPFHVHSQAKERSHGDGVMVSPDSPEAFEEILWLRHFPEHYTQDGVREWAQIDENFASAFLRHTRSLAVSRGVGETREIRYLSKNNANVARAEALKRTFPGARIIVPLRHPRDQAVSLLRQHRKAVRTQSMNGFVRRYTADIGHFEFGLNHRPILFPGVRALSDRITPMDPDYWLSYWVAAFKTLSEVEGVEFLDMTRFTMGGKVDALTDLLDLPRMDAGGPLTRPIPRHPDEDLFSRELLSRAKALYDRIRAGSNCTI